MVQGIKESQTIEALLASKSRPTGLTFRYISDWRGFRPVANPAIRPLSGPGIVGKILSRSALALESGEANARKPPGYTLVAWP